MNASLALVWALWVVHGNSHYVQPVVAAYFSTEAGCQRTLERVKKLTDGASPVRSGGPMQCIQAEYVVGVIQK